MIFLSDFLPFADTPHSDFSVSKRTPALANPVSPSHDALKSTVSSQAFVQAKKVKTSTIHEEVTEKIPEDGLTRWPSLSTHQGILRGLDWFGTSVFALAGSAAAGNCGMDILGCTVVGTITAVGGGTVSARIPWAPHTELWRP